MKNEWDLHIYIEQKSYWGIIYVLNKNYRIFVLLSFLPAPQYQLFTPQPVLA